jgi:hypothetical protein
MRQFHERREPHIEPNGTSIVETFQALRTHDIGLLGLELNGNLNDDQPDVGLWL